MDNRPGPAAGLTAAEAHTPSAQNGGQVTSSPPSLREQARGALLAAACGDALGAPFEGHTAPSRIHIDQWAASSREMTFTDDTAMMIVLAEHLCRNELQVADADLAAQFAEAWHAEPNRGYGAGPPKIFRAVLGGHDFNVAARSAFGEQGSFGNGGAMRVAPIGLLPGELHQLASTARRQAAITHAHPLGQEGAALLAVAVAAAVRSADSPLDSASFLDQLRPHVSTPEFRDALQRVRTLRLQTPPREAAAQLGNDITAVGSVPTALATFLRHSDHPREAVLAAIEAGGDTDTIATMTGALVGGRCGSTAIPAQWRQRLERSGHLVALADQITELHHGRDIRAWRNSL